MTQPALLAEPASAPAPKGRRERELVGSFVEYCHACTATPGEECVARGRNCDGCNAYETFWPVKEG